MKETAERKTYEELQIDFQKQGLEIENLKITNELLLKNIKEMRYLIDSLTKSKKELNNEIESLKKDNSKKKIEEKKERLFKND